MTHIRAAQIKDIEAILEIEKVFEKSAWSVEIFNALLSSDNAYCIVAISNEKVVGFAALEKMVETADVQTVAVLPSYQHQGIGTLLMNDLEKHARNHYIDVLFLEVDIDNFNAKKMYEKLGYQPLSIRKNYYANGHDAIVMSKEVV